MDLDSYGGNYPDGMFLLFYKKVDRKLAPKGAVIFRHLVREGSFQTCRLADVVSVPKKSSSSDVCDYRPASIAPVLSKVFEKIVTGKLIIFWKETVCFLLLSSFIVKAWERETCDMVSPFTGCFGQGYGGRFVQLNSSAAFDRVSRRGMLYKLRVIRIGQFLSVVSEFLSDRRQRLHLDGKVSMPIDVVSGVHQGSILEQLLILHTSKLFHIVGNHIVRYADDATIYAVIPRPLSRIQVDP